MVAATLAIGISLAEGSSVPVYRQIADQIRVEIEAGTHAPGDRLPTIRGLAEALGIHRDTVALAYDVLATDGWVEARVGAGTFVREGLGLAPDSDGARGLSRRGALRGAIEDRESDLALAPQVERLITLENTRSLFETGNDEAVALHRLVPDPRFYPIEEFKACIDDAWTEEGADLFSYATPEGDPRLRQALANRFRRFGLSHSPDEHVLCHGASQGISLAMRLFTQPGDQVAVEVPTYSNVLSAFAGLGISAAPVVMDADGPDPDALDRMLSKPEVKAFYTIPSFHNPLGTTAPLERRREVLAIAEHHGVPIVEDAFEIDLRFRGPEVPPLAALDETGIVVLLFSFSKSLFPGVRVGSLIARGRSLEGLVALKRATDLSDSLPLQAGLARFVEAGAYERHLVRIRKVLRARHAALDRALEASLPDGSRWTHPEGGYQRWVELPQGLDTRELLADAGRAGVLYSPGTLFMPDSRPTSAMRLTVACADEQEIERGVASLGDVIRARRSGGPAVGRTPGIHL